MDKDQQEITEEQPRLLDQEIEIDKSKMKNAEHEDISESDDDSTQLDDINQEDDGIESSESDDEAVITLTHEGPVFAVHWNPANPDLVATGGEEEKAFIWSIETRKALLTIPPKGKIGESITFVKFSPNGQRVAIVALNGVVQVWDVHTNKKVSDCNGCDGELSFIEWDSSSRGLFGGDENGLVYVWSALTGNCRILSGHQDAVTCGCFSPDGLLLLLLYFYRIPFL